MDRRARRDLSYKQRDDFLGTTLMFLHEWVAGLRIREERGLAILWNP